ncbi:MAG: helix-turn-helix transcriptional regulator [Planctomycetota bacterium]|nr:helix-turn-helix transcriptional regulator [Planctomycetota bacterium]
MQSAPQKGAIAGRLRLAREQAGLSQGQVAKLLGLHRPTVSEIEAGRRKVSAEELATFAELYDVSVEWLATAASVLDNANADRIQLAARELSKLKPQDVDAVLGLLRTLRKSGDANR